MDIYLAGNDSKDHAFVTHAIGYPFRLCSYYYLGHKNRSGGTKSIEHLWRDGSRWIMDSGLFSLMFGSEKGLLKTFDDYRDYALRYIEHMHAVKWCHPIVECDVQRVLGVDETLRIREEVFDKSGFEVIYVWHIPEGEDGLRKLARDKSYIALSVPEFRVVMGYGDAMLGKILIHLLGVIRAAGKPKVHLLGNTEQRLVALPADTCDSSSWLYATSYNKCGIYDGGGVRQISGFSPRWREWVAWCRAQYPEAFASIVGNEALTEGMRKQYGETLAASAISYWLMQDKVNGRHTTIKDLA